MSKRRVFELRARCVRALAGRALPALCWVLAVIWASPGCGSQAAPPGGDVEVEIGTGVVDFEALTPGQTLELVAGPQGGYHFQVHARMRGLAPGDPRQPGLAENPTTYFRALDESGARVDLAEIRRLGYSPDTAGDTSEATPGSWYGLPSARLLLIANEHAPRLYGRELSLEVFVEDAEGRSAGHALTIVAMPSPEPEPEPGVDAGAER
ncbi:hypothetical protein [Haliangium ochraceum]|uniref:hypothetical protein n=1 Tax=Haliangium ochraceum TaxID=80816 RepID=UPI00126A76BB|nr:hypothetical protein [Haliangium ochraceum]